MMRLKKSLLAGLLVLLIGVLFSTGVFAEKNTANQISDFENDLTNAEDLFCEAFGDEIVEAQAAGSIWSFQLTGTYQQSEARKMLQMVNDLRTGGDAWYWNSSNSSKVYCSGLGELTYDYTLEKVAMQRAMEVAVYYSHTRPNQERCFTAYPDIYGAKGENIAASTGGAYTSAKSMFDGWAEAEDDYDGQGHRRNMLSANYSGIGIGFVRYNGCYYWAMELGDICSGSAETVAADEKRTMTVEFEDSILSVNSISVNTKDIKLSAGENAALPVADVEFITSNTWPGYSYCTGQQICLWSSSNENVVMIEDGYAAAKHSGTSVVSSQLVDGTKASFLVTVVDEKQSDGLGDINLDGSIDAVDALQALRHSVKEINLKDEDFTRGDVNKDAQIDAVDALQILRFSVKEIPAF